jgi:hypothetical protein
MINCGDLLNEVVGARMTPESAVEKLLEREWDDVIEQRDGLGAVALQIAELSAHGIAFAQLGPAEAVEGRASKRIVSVHARTSSMPMQLPALARRAGGNSQSFVEGQRLQPSNFCAGE